MAAETESTPKPKAELIKKAQTEHVPPPEEAAKPPVPEHTERRKVIIVKKKIATSAAGTLKKFQPKVVTSKPAEAEASQDEKPVVQKPDTPKVETTSAPQPETVTDIPATQESSHAAAQKTEPKAKPEAKPESSEPSHTASHSAVPKTETKTEPRAETKTELKTEPKTESKIEPRPERTGIKKDEPAFTITQRPAAAAGKVGGKFVGPRPPRIEKPASTFKPPAASGTGRPPAGGGFRSGEGRPQGTGGRPAGGPPGANRQGFRPGGPGGQRPGFTPHPGGPGMRPGGTRPGGPGRVLPQGTSPIPEGKGPGKKTFKAKKPVYTRKEKELEMEEKLLQTKKKITQVTNPIPKVIEIMEVISVSELARKMNLKASNVISKLMSMGMMVTINQQIDAETATILASEYGTEVRIVSLYDETVIATASDEGAVMSPRPPVVTVMGHVDHGKTKLLDAIRSADVVSGEFGGITQHIGAYIVETPKGRLTFLDTPGHEAFTRMRARGAQVTDIVVLVVSAVDGVMPQTIEALNHAKEAKVPIIVAVNFMDKPDANPDRVKSQLSELGLMPEDWGGQTMFVLVSALKKEGIDKLIESILLQAEILDLKANYGRSAEGKILESRIDHGRGIVATVIIENGTLCIGDSFVAGIWPGKVRALFTDKGDKIEEATPSMPIEVLGFEGIPNAGDPIQVVDDEKTARTVSSKRQELKRYEDAKHITKITMENLHAMISDGEIQELKVIIKADVQGSAEALRSSLEKLSTSEIRLHVIQALPGAINEGDVDLAIASNAIIIGFNVRPIPKAKVLAEQEKVDIRKYNVIYKAVEEIQLAMEGMLKPDTKEEVIATVEVRDIFKTPKFGTIAGCYVLTGTVKRTASLNVIRDGIVLHRGRLGSLRRFKDDVREVIAGFECGLGVEGFDGIQPGDQIEVFEVIEVARKLGDG